MMKEEKVDDNIHAKSSSSLPTGLPINWGLITGPVPQPVFPTSSSSTHFPSSQCSAAHALQTKVKSLTQRRLRGRDREKERERLDMEVLGSNPAELISSEVLLRQRPRGKSQASLSALSWRSGAPNNLSSSDEEEEVEVQVRLEIHSPPARAQGEQVFQEGEEEERSENNESQVGFLTGRSCGLGEGTSLESLLSDNSSSSKDDPSPPPPPAVLSFCSAKPPTSTSSSSSPMSSTSTRHWAPPKGFWRVARPETLLLNGVGPHNIPCTLPLKDYTQSESQTNTQRKPKPAKIGFKCDVGGVVKDSKAPSDLKHPDNAECQPDRCELKGMLASDPPKGLCSSDSCESMSPQSGVLLADEKLKVKQRAYAKLRERQQNCREERERRGESARRFQEMTDKQDSKGESPGIGIL